jgi:predicted nucleic acid-binding protein
MSRVLVLDSAAVEGLCRRDVPMLIRAALEAASRLGRDVVIPSAVLAECYRDRNHVQAIDSMLARRPALRLRDTDRVLARLVGGLMATADVGSEAMVDAHVVAVAVEQGGGVCLTSDVVDLERLAAGSPAVSVVAIG